MMDDDDDDHRHHDDDGVSPSSSAAAASVEEETVSEFERRRDCAYRLAKAALLGRIHDCNDDYEHHGPARVPRALRTAAGRGRWASLGSLASEGCAWFYGEAVRVALRHVAERGAWR